MDTTTAERKQGFLGGLSVGFSQFMMFAIYGFIFWYGGKCVNKGEFTFDELFKSLMAIMFSAMGLAQSAAFMGDMGAAKEASAKLFDIVDRLPTIDTNTAKGDHPSNVDGHIEAKELVFHYPTRPDQTILDGYNLNVKAGSTVALVGESGSGKSTLIALVERFYDPLFGDVYLDGHNLKDVNVNWLRKQIGFVGQEPVLFGGTIAENIQMGKPGAHYIYIYIYT